MKNYYDYIEDYLNGELPLELRIEFEEAISQDEALRKKLHQYQDLYHRLEAASMRKKVEEVRSAGVNSKINTGKENVKIKKGFDKNLFNLNFIMKIAATFVMLIAALWYLFKNRDDVGVPAIATEASQKKDSSAVDSEFTPDKDTLHLNSSVKVDVVHNNTPELYGEQIAYLNIVKRNRINPDFATLRSAENANPDSIKRKAIAAYQLEQFSDVIKILGQLSTEDESMLFLRANAFLSTQQFDLAQKDFDKLQTSFQYKYDAQWNSLLCILAKKDLAAVRTFLKKILDDKEHPFHEKAEKLQQQLAIYRK